MHNARILFLPIVFCALFWGCDKGTSPEPAPLSTFDKLNEAVLSQNCATSGCHVSASRAGGLALDNGNVYETLVNKAPSNAQARSEGLVLIWPGRPDSSFLFRKIEGDLKPGFGDRMPLNRTSPLPSNYREFIRQWISAGAPRSGIVADERLLEDPIVFNDTFVPPQPPQDGFQLHVRPFSIDPTSEREIFVFQKSPVSDTQYVSGIDIAMREGSHHFILYAYYGEDLVEGSIRDLNQSSIFEALRPARQYLIGSQTPIFSYQFPPNVVLPLIGNPGFDLNSHYVNEGSSVRTGEVYINVKTVAKNDSLRSAIPIFDNYLGFFLPRNARTTITRTVLFDSPRSLFVLSSHTHKRGETFRIYRVGGPDEGALIYENFSWDHPPAVTFNPPLTFQQGWGYRIEVVYNNETNRDLRFGFTSEDEMCIVLGYYYQ